MFEGDGGILSLWFLVCELLVEDVWSPEEIERPSETPTNRSSVKI